MRCIATDAGHAFDSFDRCDCGLERCLSEGKFWYKVGRSWCLQAPACTRPPPPSDGRRE